MSSFGSAGESSCVTQRESNENYCPTHWKTSLYWSLHFWIWLVQCKMGWHFPVWYGRTQNVHLRSPPSNFICRLQQNVKAKSHISRVSSEQLCCDNVENTPENDVFALRKSCLVEMLKCITWWRRAIQAVSVNVLHWKFQPDKMPSWGAVPLHREGGHGQGLSKVLQSWENLPLVWRSPASASHDFCTCQARAG